MNSPCDDEDKFFQFSTSSSQHRDVTDQIFSLGDGRLNSRANCRGTVNCKYGTFSFRCSNTYRSNDEFRDPLDFHERFGIEFEPGGTPYDIIIIWPGSYSGSGSF